MTGLNGVSSVDLGTNADFQFWFAHYQATSFEPLPWFVVKHERCTSVLLVPFKIDKWIDVKSPNLLYSNFIILNVECWMLNVECQIRIQVPVPVAGIKMVVLYRDCIEMGVFTRKWVDGVWNLGNFLWDFKWLKRLTVTHEGEVKRLVNRSEDVLLKFGVGVETDARRMGHQGID